jgi:hypothetical protein
MNTLLGFALAHQHSVQVGAKSIALVPSRFCYDELTSCDYQYGGHGNSQTHRGHDHDSPIGPATLSSED